ncbi:MAG TPA: hypothetical protein VIH82_03045 [Acidimicrobiia bacterium]
MTPIPVVIDHRFCGPDWSGQGGYSCGLVGVAAGNPAEVRLRRPPPLDQPMQLREEHEGVMLFDQNDCVVAEGWSIEELDVVVPTPPVTHAEAQAAADAYLASAMQPGGHPFPRCFGCGYEREPGDGLRIFAGPVPGREGLFASPWVPDASLLSDVGAGSDELPDEITWAALDCPTGAPVIPKLTPDEAIVLGTMSAHIVRRPRVGYRYVIMSWLEQREERVAWGAAALLGERGDVLATSRGTWVFVDRERFGGR